MYVCKNNGIEYGSGSLIQMSVYSKDIDDEFKNIPLPE